ncbi:MAG TPA: LysE family transporter [Candidatus Lokiarchaeia archaeon]|nr:LysE family transporter [Candidatus Lokiarchaeia archaeon]
MTIEEFFLVLTGSFLIGLSGAMMPGPVTTMTINETIKYMKRGHGWLVGPSIATGHAMLEICLILALWFGASFIFHVHLVIIIIGVVGGAALIVFGILGLKSTRKSEQEFTRILESVITENEAERADIGTKMRPLIKPLALGFILSSTSAGWWAWWASIGLNAINLSSSLFSSFDVFITFYFGHILSDFSWFTFISGIVASGKKRISMKAYVIILFITNAFLVGLGVYFIISALA